VVKPYDLEHETVDRSIKSYGNGLTAPHDICDQHDAKALIYLLAESVAQRMREGGARARTIAIGVRSAELTGYTRQTHLRTATNSTSIVAATAWQLLRTNQELDAEHPLRSLHVRASDLELITDPVQLSFWDNSVRMENLDASIDELRRRFGNTCIQRGIELTDASLQGLDIKRDNVVHPVGFFHV
jgi:DNA polymerase-4